MPRYSQHRCQLHCPSHRKNILKTISIAIVLATKTLGLISNFLTQFHRAVQPHGSSQCGPHAGA